MRCPYERPSIGLHEGSMSARRRVDARPPRAGRTPLRCRPPCRRPGRRGGQQQLRERVPGEHLRLAAPRLHTGAQYLLQHLELCGLHGSDLHNALHGGRDAARRNRRVQSLRRSQLQRHVLVRVPPRRLRPRLHLCAGERDSSAQRLRCGDHRISVQPLDRRAAGPVPVHERPTGHRVPSSCSSTSGRARAGRSRSAG